MVCRCNYDDEKNKTNQWRVMWKYDVGNEDCDADVCIECGMETVKVEARGYFVR